MTHLLTLIAFAAHAVLGCCWHHSHALGNACCVQHADQVASADTCGDADHDHHHATAVCCDHSTHSHAESHAAVTPTTKLAVSDLAIETATLTDADSPCGHSHNCDEAHCQFVGMFSKWLDLDLQAVSVPFAFSTVAVLAETPRAAVDGDFDRRCRARVLSSSESCVRLQSWQI
ncbi:hypothetical protein SH528x_007134 [Novipirellula sp. SH528]|uniref:hypothetical protein n=1 Tax=Novipirellula sp. SH528 TaxID=3454466 RepID=UPI003F9FF943